MLGRLLAEWGEGPAGCLFLLPLWHPVLVAEQIGTLAAIARGPFIMQCGLGWGEARFAAMGASIRTRPSAFEEALDIVRRLLAGETVSSSRRFRVAEASLALRPAEPVEVSIGASAAPLMAGYRGIPQRRSSRDRSTKSRSSFGLSPNSATLTSSCVISAMISRRSWAPWDRLAAVHAALA
jgi:alkanesulfonate monooxygenase SsuD/methylene tetrahydromethanopterin reductase-like flavin-dependent oxidoreductase (luciferase family)